MKELEEEGSTPDHLKPVEAEKKKSGSSDDDAVLVDAGGPAQAQGAGGTKKRKGKK